MFIARDIDIDACEALPPERCGSARGFGFAVSGGVASAVAAQRPEGPAPTLHAVNGLSTKMIKILAAYAKTGKAPGNLLEVMCCEGGCVAGPCSFEDPARATSRLRQRAVDLPGNRSL